MSNYANDDERVLHRMLDKAFSNSDVEIYKNFRYKAIDSDKCPEIDHCIIDRKHRLMVIFGDKSFEGGLIKSANRACRNNARQNFNMRRAISKNSRLIVHTSNGKTEIDISDIQRMVIFSVIYSVNRVENSVSYIQALYNANYKIVSNANKIDYNQLIISYNSLIRILEICCNNKIQFSYFLDLITTIYAENKENIELGISIHSAFECIYNDISNKTCNIHLIIADTLQNGLKIEKSNYTFFSKSPYIIHTGCSYAHFKHIVRSFESEIGLRVLSKNRYIQIIHAILDEVLGLDELDEFQCYKIKKAARFLIDLRYVGVIIIGFKIIVLEHSDIEYILNSIIEHS